jgi:6-phosphofructokinase 1
MARMAGNVVIGQSGGPTAVINQSLVGIVETVLGQAQVKGVYGMLHGIKGLLEQRLVDLGQESKATLEAVAQTPCAALGSVRKKPTREECQQALEVLKAHDIRWMFYIGGNDSAETAHILHEIASAEGFDLRLYHVPKTIDNDLRVNDHCPGFGSAARFVACAMIGDDLDGRSLPGIKIDVIMGRHAGWLTAASTLGREREDDGPHLVYVPESVFQMDQFLSDVDRVYKQHGRCLVAVSEGVHGPSGKPLLESGEVDSHGNVQLSGSGALGDYLAEQIRRNLGQKLRVRADTFGYLQRSFLGCVSEVDQREAREVGRTAARLALEGQQPHGTVVIRRSVGSPYRATFERAELAQVAKNTRPMEPAFLRGANDIAPAFREYCAPLVGGLPLRGWLARSAVASRPL